MGAKMEWGAKTRNTLQYQTMHSPNDDAFCETRRTQYSNTEFGAKIVFILALVRRSDFAFKNRISGFIRVRQYDTLTDRIYLGRP